MVSFHREIHSEFFENKELLAFAHSQESLTSTIL